MYVFMCYAFTKLFHAKIDLLCGGVYKRQNSEKQAAFFTFGRGFCGLAFSSVGSPVTLAL
jgi:hypothetical protein